MKKNLILTAIAVLCCAMISCSKDDTTPQGAGNPEPVVIPVIPDLGEDWSMTDLFSNSSADFRLAVANLTEEIPRGWYGFDITIGALEIVRPPKQDGSTGSINNPFTGKTRAEIAALTGPTGTLLAANMDKPGKL